MKYLATFYGRTIHAIGVYSAFKVEVTGKNKKEAELKLYETHEHISGLELIEIK